MKILLKILIFMSLLFLRCDYGCSYESGFIIFTFLPKSLSWIKISSYGIMMAAGFLTANFLLQREFYRKNIDIKLADNIIILAVVFGIVGAKVFFLWETSNEWHTWDEFKHRAFSGGGLTWLGGFVGATTANIIYAKRNRIFNLSFVDIFAPIIAMGYGFGRLGCLVSGDGCYGKICDLSLPSPLCMSFPNGALPTKEFVYNTPFYESTFSFLLFMFLWLFREKKWPDGSKFFLFLALHSISRFVVEFIRLNPRDVMGMTQAQFVSMVSLLVCMLFLFAKRQEFIKLLVKVKNE
ncbi:MAG: prolipoprotein diacylglyceryl transferase [Spirochaetia bacterium]|nr:prolipoprotein diacylglyceryl transferase [Spirochaetia bacterium]